MAKRHRRLSLGCLAIHQVSGPTPCVRDPPNKWIAGYADEQFEQAHQNSPTQGSPVVSRPAGLVWRVDGATLQTAQSLVWQMPYPLFVSLAPTHAPCELVVAKPMCKVGLYANPTRLTTRNRSAKCWRLASDCNLSDRKAADHQRRVMAGSRRKPRLENPNHPRVYPDLSAYDFFRFVRRPPPIDRVAFKIR